MMDMWKMDMGHAESDALLTWYCDVYIPAAAGALHFGEKTRCYKTLVDVGPIGPNNEEKVLVPIMSEAFGLLCFENCREKWIATFEFKKAYGEKAKIPTGKKNPESARFKAKYSDSCDGQVKGGGWKPEAYTKFQEYIDLIKGLRAEDQAIAWTKHQYALSLVRNKHKVTLDSPQSAGKRRRKSLVATEERPEVDDIVIIDE
jgi:hypothetical protein